MLCIFSFTIAYTVLIELKPFVGNFIRSSEVASKLKYEGRVHIIRVEYGKNLTEG